MPNTANNSASLCVNQNSHVDNLFVGEFENNDVWSEKSGNSHNVITHNVILADKKNESFMYGWLHTHAIFDVICLPAFVRASDVISSGCRHIYYNGMWKITTQ